jgi:uncharacterized protein
VSVAASDPREGKSRDGRVTGAPPGEGLLTLYFDASAFTKLFLAEVGSVLAAELWALETPLVSSAITYAETSAAIAAARRGRRLSRVAANEALRRLDAEWDAVTPVDVDDRLTRAAGLIAVRHGLRGMDAIHLASALSIARAHPVVVSWDPALRRAAQSEGLAISV